MTLDTCNQDCTDTSHSGPCRARQSRLRAHAPQAHGTERTVVAHAPVRTVVAHAPDRTQPRTTPDYDDADVYMSDICRRTKGKVTLPGDSGYSGVCKLVDGQWIVPKAVV